MSTMRALTASAIARRVLSEVAIISGRRWAIIHELGNAEEPSLAEMLAKLSPCDLVLIEGYKRESHPKIEARRLAATDHEPLSDKDTSIRAIAADHPATGSDIPVFALDDIPAIADMITRETGLVRTEVVDEKKGASR